MPDLIPAKNGIFDRHPEVIEITGFQLQFIPYFMRGRNDIKTCFSTFFCETINYLTVLKRIMIYDNRNVCGG